MVGPFFYIFKLGRSFYNNLEVNKKRVLVIAPYVSI